MAIRVEKLRVETEAVALHDDGLRSSGLVALSSSRERAAQNKCEQDPLSVQHRLQSMPPNH